MLGSSARYRTSIDLDVVGTRERESCHCSQRRSSMSRVRAESLRLGGGVAASVVVIAFAIRLAVEQRLRIGESVSLVGDVLQLTRGTNSGVAFGFLRGSPVVPWLTAVAVIGIALVAAQQQSRLSSLAWGLILGGGLANVIDRAGDSRVTDYIDVTIGRWHYPTFNVPDIAITLGFVLLLWTVTLGDKPRHEHAQRDPTPAIYRNQYSGDE